MYVLDTTVLVDLIRTRSARIKRNLREHSKSTIGISVVTACELQYGIERAAERHSAFKAEQETLLAQLLAPLEIFALDSDVMATYGHVRATLARTGESIGPLDTFIAAHALSLGATLVTSNVKEFQRVPGLTVKDWAA